MSQTPDYSGTATSLGQCAPAHGARAHRARSATRLKIMLAVAALPLSITPALSPVMARSRVATASPARPACPYDMVVDGSNHCVQARPQCPYDMVAQGNQCVKPVHCPSDMVKVANHCEPPKRM